MKEKSSRKTLPWRVMVREAGQQVNTLQQDHIWDRRILSCIRDLAGP